MTFQFDVREQPTADITLDNPGQTCIRAMNTVGDVFYLQIRTILGWTEVIQYGPFHMLIPALKAKITYEKFEYKEGKVFKAIELFLNSGGICDAIEISPFEMFDAIDEFAMFLKGDNE